MAPAFHRHQLLLLSLLATKKGFCSRIFHPWDCFKSRGSHLCCKNSGFYHPPGKNNLWIWITALCVHRERRAPVCVDSDCRKGQPTLQSEPKRILLPPFYAGSYQRILHTDFRPSLMNAQNTLAISNTHLCANNSHMKVNIQWRRV